MYLAARTLRQISYVCVDLSALYERVALGF